MRIPRPLALVLLGLAASSGPFASPVAAQGAPSVVSVSPFYFPFNDREISAFGAGPTVTLNGNVYFDLPKIELCFGLDPTMPSGGCSGGATMEFDMKAGLALELTADQTGTISRRIPVAVVPFAFFYFPLVPQLTGWILLDADLILEGQVEAGMRLGLVGQFDLGGNMDYFGSGTASAGVPENTQFEFSTPEFTGATGLDLTVAFEGGVSVLLAVGGVPIGGPYLKVRTGVELRVDPPADPWWQANAFVSPAAGWDFGVLPGSAAVYGPQLDIPLLDAGGPLAIWNDEPVRWSRTYDVENLELVSSVLPVDGGFVAVGTYGTASSTPWFAGLAPDGSVVWEQESQFTSGNFSSPTDVVALPGGGFASGGARGAGGGTRLDVFEPDGEALWTQGYVDAAGETLDTTGMIATQSGGFALGGTVRRGLKKNPMVVKLDAIGGVEWASEYTLDVLAGVDSCATAQLIELSDGRLVLCGQAYYEDGPPGSQTVGSASAMLVAFHPDGTLDWARVYGSLAFEYATCVTQVDGGDLMFAGKIPQTNTCWVARVQSDGTLVWSKSLAAEDASGNDLVRDIVAVPGGALLAGTTQIGAATDGWLARADHDGDIVWFKSFRGPDLDEFHGIERLDNGLIAWGTTRSTHPVGSGGSESDMWIARAAHDGMLQFDGQYDIDVHNDRRKQSGTSGVVQLDLPGAWTPFTVLPDTVELTFGPIAALVTLLTL